MIEETLNWIARNQNAAAGLAFFLLLISVPISVTIHNFFDLLTNTARAFTGKYPPPRPVVKVECPCSEQCDYHEEAED